MTTVLLIVAAGYLIAIFRSRLRGRRGAVAGPVPAAAPRPNAARYVRIHRGKGGF